MQYHTCALPPDLDELQQKYIPGTGYCAAFRRILFKFRTVSESNPQTKEFLKSKTMIEEERYRHFHYYPCIIHPFSTFRMYWEFFMSIILLSILLTNPVYIALSDTFRKQFTFPKLALDFVCLIDIIVNFVTGYYSKTGKEVILNPRKIILMYIFSYFWIDLLSSLPELLFQILDLHKLLKVQLIWFLTALKIFRLNTFLVYIGRIKNKLDISTFYFRICKLILVITMTLFWTSCLLFLAINNPSITAILVSEQESRHFFNSSEDYKLASIIFRSSHLLLLIGHGLEKSYHTHEVILKICLLVAGMVFHIYITYNVLQLIKTKDSASAKYWQILQQLYEYMRYKGLSESIKRRTIRYYELRFRKTFFDENEIFANVTVPLKQEIIMHSSRKVVENIPFFKGLPASLLFRIITYLKTEIYLPNDIIVQHGTVGDAMYFINSGTVAVYTAGGREVCHMEDGAYFGEIALIMENEQRVATVIAIESCELFILTRKDFHCAMDPYPQVYRNMRRQAIESIERITKLEIENNRIAPALVANRLFHLSQISGVNSPKHYSEF